MNKKMILKIAILSCCLVTVSQNAIAGNIPAIAYTFKNVALSTIELMTTIPSLFVMLAILLNGFLAKRMNHKTSLLIGLLICGIGGIIPYFIKEVYIMLISRAIFGFVDKITADTYNIKSGARPAVTAVSKFIDSKLISHFSRMAKTYRPNQN